MSLEENCDMNFQHREAGGIPKVEELRLGTRLGDSGPEDSYLHHWPRRVVLVQFEGLVRGTGRVQVDSTTASRDNQLPDLGSWPWSRRTARPVL